MVAWGVLFCLKWASWLAAFPANIFEKRGEPFGALIKILAGLSGLIFFGIFIISLFVYDWPELVFQVSFGLYIFTGMLLCRILKSTTDDEFEHLVEPTGMFGEADKKILKELLWPWFLFKLLRTGVEAPSDASSFVCLVLLLGTIITGVLLFIGAFVSILNEAWFLLFFIVVTYFLARAPIESLKKEMSGEC